MVAIRKTVASRIANELDSDAHVRFRRAFSPGIQEYIEARTFLSFISSRTLLTPKDIEAEFGAACRAEDHGLNVPLEPSDYVLGVADLTGELMRCAVAAAGRSDGPALHKIWEFLKGVEEGLKCFEKGRNAIGRDFPMKMKVLKTSVDKVEKSRYDIAVRRAEVTENANRVVAKLDGESEVKRRRVE